MNFNNFYFFISKKLRIGFHFGVGRSFGRISIHHCGGGQRKKSIFVDFFRRIILMGLFLRLLKHRYLLLL